MSSGAAALRRGETFRLVRACAGLLAVSAALGSACNLARPAPTRLPWIGDWEHHIENLAFRAGIPVAFLAGVQARVEDPAVVVFDARIPEEYAAGHLPRALNLPTAEAGARLGAFADRLTPATPILVYCGGPDCDDALELALKLRAYGFQDLTLYPGGHAEWTEYEGAIRTGGES